MKKIILTFAVVAVAAISLVKMSSPVTAQEKPQRELLHVVAFNFNEDLTEAQIKEVEDAFRALKGKISQIKDYKWGTNNSPEGLNQGCTHGFVLKFHSEEDRNAYLIHPDHKAFGKLLGGKLEKVFVIDFWAND